MYIKAPCTNKGAAALCRIGRTTLYDVIKAVVAETCESASV